MLRYLLIIFYLVQGIRYTHFRRDQVMQCHMNCGRGKGSREHIRTFKTVIKSPMHQLYDLPAYLPRPENHSAAVKGNIVSIAIYFTG